MLYADVPRVMTHVEHFQRRGIALALHPTPRAGVRLSKQHVYIDVFGFEDDPEAPSFLTRSGRWHTIWGSPGPKENFPFYFVQPPLINVTFEGMVSSHALLLPPPPPPSPSSAFSCSSQPRPTRREARVRAVLPGVRPAHRPIPPTPASPYALQLPLPQLEAEACSLGANQRPRPWCVRLLQAL
jgi:hypothetical protein